MAYKANVKKLSETKRSQIVNEIIGKVKAYEQRMTYRLNRWNALAEMFTCREATTGENFHATPDTAELYKAIRALTNMSYRMLTSQKPFFELEATDLIGYADPAKLVYAEHYVRNQLDITNYNSNLHKALYQTFLYGTCAIQETFEPIRHSFIAKPRYATTFKPISLVNCAFALDSYSVNDCSWVALSDVTSSQYLETIKRTDPSGSLYDLSVLDKIKEEKYSPDVNQWVNQRMSWAGYTSSDFSGGIETTTYYGPLDTLNDNVNYVVDVVNRKHIIRCEVYEGLRPVRIATINEVDIEPLGNGVGDLFKPVLKEMEETRNALHNTTTLAGANMFVKSKSYGEEDSQWVVRNFGIVELDGNIAPFGPSPATIPTLRSQYADLLQEFRQGSGATDTLQAMVHGDSATATEVSLAMNEAVRNLSVTSELLSEPLVREHIKVILQNAFYYQNEALTLNIPDKTNPNKSIPVTITPDVLKIDTNVRVKTMTDQDFRPSKINHLLQVSQLMSAIPPNGLNGYKVNTAPVLLEILKTMDVPNFEQAIQPITEQDLIRASIVNQMSNIQQGSQQAITNEGELTPGRAEARAVNAINSNEAAGLVTPVGRVLSAPGDDTSTTQAIRAASTGTETVQIPPRR